MTPNPSSLPKGELRLVLLGPGEDQRQDYQKRKDILGRLHSLGYVSAKLGEEVVGENPQMPLHLALYEHLGEIDLILVLDTGPAALAELATLHRDYRARQITKVWYKREYFTGRRTTPGDIVMGFDNWPFNQEEFETCELTDEFISAADRSCLNKAQFEGRLTGLGLLPPP